ncbi:MAG: RNA polymerase sigma-70 factor [Bacteroidota bacterium]|nr:RNA polymerase sigma-70 factor [Bacteroidota bacterium]
MINTQDNELLKGIREGDLTSFESLYETYYQPLCNFAYLFLNDEEASRDLVSELFVGLWNRRKKLNIKQSIKSYMYKSAKNAVVSYQRKRKIRFVELKEEAIEPLSDVSPEILLLKKEFQSVLNQAIGGLPEKSGLVFRMKKLDGLSYREIAQVLNITEKTVENHMAIAIRKIRLALQINPELGEYLNP